MEDNNQVPNINNSNENKGYYTTLNRKLLDYFMTLAISLILMLLLSQSSPANFFGLFVAILLILLIVMILSFTYQRKFIGFAILTLFLIPLLFIGSCFMGLGGMRI